MRSSGPFFQPSSASSHHLLHKVDGHWEYNRRILPVCRNYLYSTHLFRADVRQCLQIPQLQCAGRRADHIGGVSQRMRRLLLALGGDDLVTGICGIVGVTLTRALAVRVASASAAIALCKETGRRTSLISTRSTLIPQESVASSRMF